MCISRIKSVLDCFELCTGCLLFALQHCHSSSSSKNLDISDDGSNGNEDHTNIDLIKENDMDGSDSDTDADHSIQSDLVIPAISTNILDETERIQVVEPPSSFERKESWETKSSFLQSPKKNSQKFDFEDSAEHYVHNHDLPPPTKTVKETSGRKLKPSFTERLKRKKQKGGVLANSNVTSTIPNKSPDSVILTNQNLQSEEGIPYSPQNNMDGLNKCIDGDDNSDENESGELDNQDSTEVKNEMASENQDQNNIQSGSIKIKSKLRSVATTVKDGTTKTTKNVAKTVRNGTILTSKGIVKSAIQVRKGAVIASRATSRVVSSQRPRGRPPVREPRKLLKAGNAKALKSKTNKSKVKVVKGMRKIK